MTSSGWTNAALSWQVTATSTHEAEPIPSRHAALIFQGTARMSVGTVTALDIVWYVGSAAEQRCAQLNARGRSLVVSASPCLRQGQGWPPVQDGQEAGSAAAQAGSAPITNSALKLAKWMHLYGELLRCPVTADHRPSSIVLI